MSKKFESNINIRIEQDVMNDLSKICAERHIKYSEEIRKLIRQYVKELKETTV